jgi:hypothetical protein
MAKQNLQKAKKDNIISFIDNMVIITKTESLEKKLSIFQKLKTKNDTLIYYVAKIYLELHK